MELLEHEVEADGAPRFDGFEQCDLEQDLFRRRVTQADFRVRKDFENPRERFGRGHGCFFLERRNFGFRDLQHVQIAARDLEQEQVAEMIQQIGEQPAQVFAMLRQIVQLTQGRRNLSGEHSPAEFQNLTLRGQAEHGEHVGFLNLVAAKADELVERALGIAHPAIGAAGNRKQRRVINLHLFQFCDVREVLDDQRGCA